MDFVYALLVVGAFAGFLVWAARRSRQLDDALLAHLAPRGFVREPNLPSFDAGAVRFEPRVAFRGPSCVLVFGRGIGERLGDEPLTSTGHFFYIYALLDGERDEEWRARLKGDTRALQGTDGRTIVYWQLRGTNDNVDRALRDLDVST
jgi:hypothetical protein